MLIRMATMQRGEWIYNSISQPHYISLKNQIKLSSFYNMLCLALPCLLLIISIHLSFGVSIQITLHITHLICNLILSIPITSYLFNNHNFPTPLIHYLIYTPTAWTNYYDNVRLANHTLCGDHFQRFHLPLNDQPGITYIDAGATTGSCNPVVGGTRIFNLKLDRLVK